ncbi:S-layer homology domain-containing protein [Lysinibacillus sp. NPDC092081]|uniref:S-layer homology domain-containing protein n=1 Tax=Lysinibacillus sp. NPDC092081 TaxID=3364131 RepID=UPI00382066DA
MKKVLYSLFFALILSVLSFNVLEAKASEKLSNRAEAIVEIGKLLGLDGTQRETQFKDVPKSHYASGYIQSAVDRGIINGYPDGTFKPSQELTRAHIALFISRAFGSKLPTGNETFKDVKKDDSAYSAIQQLVAAGITTGYPDGTFKPNNKLTQDHLKTFISRTDSYLKTGKKPTSNNNTSKGYGTLKGTVIWKYNDFIGTKGDTGAAIYLFPTNATYPSYTKQELFNWLERKNELKDVYRTLVDANGNYTFNNLPTGNYIAVISSKNAHRNLLEALNPHDQLKTLFGDYNYEIFEANAMTIYKHQIRNIEISDKSTVDFSADFGYSAW